LLIVGLLYGCNHTAETRRSFKVASVVAADLEIDMTLARRQFLHLAAGAAALSAASTLSPTEACAQAYPSRPVRIIVGVVAGSANDILARLIAHWLSERLGQPFIVENRPGAATNIATETVVHAPADGYTLLMFASSSAINVALYDKLNFVFVRDIAPVASIAHQPQIMLVHPSLPVRTLPEFIAYAKDNPGRINMASSGAGTSVHIAGELFKMTTGVDIVHVPYRGGAPAITDLLAGQVQVMFPVSSSSIEHIKKGTLRPLAVTTTQRWEALPNIPTIGEFVPGYEASTWFGIGAPRSTPATIVDRLNSEINAALADPKMRSKLADLGGEVSPRSPAEFRKFIADETERWGKVIRFAGIKAE
jgi:tripartite-type tricarboxylate transporter receptor subunit TctC